MNGRGGWRKGMLLLWVVAFVWCAGASPAWSQPKLSREEVQKLYVDYLEGEGYRATIDSDGDVTFKVEGRYYFIHVLPEDPAYFRLVMPNIWEIEDDLERARAIFAVNYTNLTTKVAKSYLTTNNVWISVEIFVGAPGDFKKIFARSLSAIDFAASTFVERMRQN